MIVELAVDHLARGADDGAGAALVEQPEFAIGFRRGELDDAERANDRPSASGRGRCGNSAATARSARPNSDRREPRSGRSCRSPSAWQRDARCDCRSSHAIKSVAQRARGGILQRAQHFVAGFRWARIISCGNDPAARLRRPRSGFAGSSRGLSGRLGCRNRRRAPATAGRFVGRRFGARHRTARTAGRTAPTDRRSS